MSTTRSDKLRGLAVIVTGGDSGIGRAVAIACAREGADVAILYLDEYDDAAETRRLVEEAGVRCTTIAGDIGDVQFCRDNAAEQRPRQSLEEITPEQLERTFRTNVFGMFHLTTAALPHLKPRR